MTLECGILTVEVHAAQSYVAMHKNFVILPVNMLTVTGVVRWLLGPHATTMCLDVIHFVCSVSFGGVLISFFSFLLSL